MLVASGVSEGGSKVAPAPLAITGWPLPIWLRLVIEVLLAFSTISGLTDCELIMEVGSKFACRVR